MYDLMYATHKTGEYYICKINNEKNSSTQQQILASCYSTNIRDIIIGLR